MTITSLPDRVQVLVIGAGPAGIVSLKYVKEYGVDLGILDEAALNRGEGLLAVEMEDDIGGTFKYRAYENAELVSSKQLTCFSDFRYPLSAPDHPSLPNFVQYLHDYGSTNGLFPHIRTRVKVVGLERDETSQSEYQHTATVQRLSPSGQPNGPPHTIECQRVIITTGLHVIPNIPPIPGLNVDVHPHSPAWLHSSDYKHRSQVEGKKVLVLGAGETGMDLVYESLFAPASKVWMGIRSGFLSFPKVLNHFTVFGSTFEGNLPIDGLITNLFETAYVHPWVAASHLRWFVSDWVVKRVLWSLTGTTAGCNQWAGELPPERQGRAYVFLNKSAKAMPYINRPYQSLSRLHRWIAHYQDPPTPLDSAGRPVENPTIHVVPFPSSFDETGRAVFPPPPKHREKETGWKEDCRPDLVLLATGYKQDFGWARGYKRPEECDVRGLMWSGDRMVGYIGFLRPGVGAIPPMAEQQIQLFLLLSAGRIPIPSTPEHYHLLHTPQGRIQYGVDYSSYMSQLARDMGSAPGLGELWKEYGIFVLLIYCFGAAFPTFYRLVGPYKSDKAADIVKTELYETIQRRGALGNLFMGVIPMAFYAIINLTALAIEKTLKLVLLPISGRTGVGSIRLDRVKEKSA